MMTGSLVRKGGIESSGGAHPCIPGLGRSRFVCASPDPSHTKYGVAEISNGSKIYKKSDKNKRRMNFKRRKPVSAFGWRMRGFTCFEVR